MRAYLATQVDAIQAGDRALQAGDFTVVHPTRVGCRRFRSTLRTFRALLPGRRASRLGAELRWWAGVLGEVRDRQVLRGLLEEVLTHLPDAEAAERLRPGVLGAVDAELLEAKRDVQAAITTPRHDALLAELPEFLLTEHVGEADAPAALARTRAVVERRLAAVRADGDPEALHAVRKAAKRARYAAEAVGPNVSGDAASAQKQLFERMQEVLGRYQDLIVADAFLESLPAAPAGATARDLAVLRDAVRRLAQEAHAATLAEAHQAGLTGRADPRGVAPVSAAS